MTYFMACNESYIILGWGCSYLAHLVLIMCILHWRLHWSHRSKSNILRIYLIARNTISTCILWQIYFIFCTMIANMTFDSKVKIIYKIRLFGFKCKYLLLAMIQCLPKLFARASGYVADLNTCNKLLTQKLLKQGYRYHKLRKTFAKF